MKGYFFALILALSAGCATLGTEITSENNHVTMPHYSFVLPADQGWHIRRANEKHEAVIITKKMGSILLQIKLFRNPILDKEMQANSAKTVADDYRQLEKSIMVEQGVNKGLYILKDVKMDEEVTGNKTFYTMNYTITANSGIQRAGLYLYFHKPSNNDYFIMAHYSETTPANALLEKTYKPDFLKVLESLSIRE
jgi:hypothetical protein